MFLTGSSRLQLQGFFGGANDITDLSCDLQAATALGYTWSDIECLYGEQLVLLEKLYGSRSEVPRRMEEWYSNHRWSPDISDCVFNPLSVNVFMKSGEFRAHWTKETEGLLLLFNKSLFGIDVLRLLVKKDARFTLTLEQLKGVGWGKLKYPPSYYLQLSLLVLSGVLTISPDCNYKSSPLPLMIANLESRARAESILQSTFQSFLTHGVRCAVQDYCTTGDAVAMIVALEKSGELSRLALEFARDDMLIERNVYRSVTALILAARPDQLLFDIRSELFSKWLDLVLSVRGGDTGFAMQLKWCAQSKGSSNSSSAQLCKSLDDGLEQLRSNYEDFKMDGVNISTRRYSCVLFGKDAQMLAYTTAVSHKDISDIQEHLRSGKGDNRVVWMQE
jgi:hypothetical protein